MAFFLTYPNHPASQQIQLHLMLKHITIRFLFVIREFSLINHLYNTQQYYDELLTVFCRIAIYVVLTVAAHRAPRMSQIRKICTFTQGENIQVENIPLERNICAYHRVLQNVVSGWKDNRAAASGGINSWTQLWI